MRAARAGLLVVVAALAALPAAAQSISLTFSASAQATFNALDCEVTEPLDLIVDSEGFTPGEPLTLRGLIFDGVAGAGTSLQCPQHRFEREDGTEVFVLEGVTANSAGNLVLPDSPGQGIISLEPAAFLADACPEGARVSDGAFCLFAENLASRPRGTAGVVPISFDTDIPAQPEIGNIVAGDERLRFSVLGLVEGLGDVYEYTVFYRPCDQVADGGVGDVDGGAPDAPDDGGVTQTDVLEDVESVCGAPGPWQSETFNRDPIELTDLQNGLQYELRVIVRDDFDNESELSEAVTATPLEQLGPMDFYNGRGSPYSFSPDCGAAGGGWLPGVLALLLGALGLRRRRGRGALLAIVLAPALLAGASRADNGNMTLSFFGGPYRPAIDTELTGGEPIYPIYGCFFDDATLPELGIAFDYHLLDVFGSLQLGVAFSGAQARGFARPVSSLSPGAIANRTCGPPTENSVELTILKLKPQLTYRFDPLLDWFGFPLVPYGRLALVGAGYAFTSNGLPQEARDASQDPVGVVFGYEAAVGVMLALDFWDYLDPFSRFTTRRARARGIFNHAFLYAEAAYQPVDNFGRPGLVFSPQDPFLSSSVPWTAYFGVAVELL